MNIINPKALLGAVLLSGISLGLLAQPEPGQRPYQQRDQKNFPAMNLSDEQKAEMKEIRLATTKETQPWKDELQINRAKINALLHRDNPDMDEIASLVETNGKLVTKIRVREIESRIRIRSLLDEDQKAIFDAHSGKMHGRKIHARHYPGRGIQHRGRF